MIKCVARIERGDRDEGDFFREATEVKEKIAETSQTEVRLIINRRKGVAVVYQKMPKEAK